MRGWAQHTRIASLANALGAGTHTGWQNSHSKLATRLSWSPNLGRDAVQGSVTSTIGWTIPSTLHLQIANDAIAVDNYTAWSL